MTWPIPGAGATGATGPAGPTGATGATGPTGPTGPAGSANASGTGGVLGKFTGAGASTTIGDSAITDNGSAVTVALPTTITDATTIRKAGIGATKTRGLLLQNNTAGTAGTPVQISPSFELEAHARVSGADQTHLIRITEMTNTSGNPSLLVEYSTDGGATYSTAFQWVKSSAGQFVEGLSSFTYLCTGASTGYVFDADNSGLFRGGSGDLQVFARAAALPMLLRSPTTTAGQASFRLYANGGTRGAGEALFEVGDVAAGFVRRLAIMGDGSILLQRLPVTVDVSTSLSVAASDTGKLITTSNAGAVAVLLPAGSRGLFYRFKNKGAGVATLTPNGAEKLFTSSQVSTFALATGDACEVAWDETDWCVL